MMKTNGNKIPTTMLLRLLKSALDTGQLKRGDVLEVLGDELDECRARLLKFAGSAVLRDGSTGPAPYAECVAQTPSGPRVVMHWGDDPDGEAAQP